MCWADKIIHWSDLEVMMYGWGLWARSTNQVWYSTTKSHSNCTSLAMKCLQFSRKLKTIEFSYVWERSTYSLLPCQTQVLAWQRPWENKLKSFIWTRITHSHVTAVAPIRCQPACLVCKPANHTDAFYRLVSQDNVCVPDNCINVINVICAL